MLYDYVTFKLLSITDCPLYEIPGDSTSYITVVNNVNFTIPCAVGTLYNHSKCGCGDVAEGSVDNCEYKTNL